MLSKLNHTQVSNDFIEQHMKKLTGAEVKVFLAICRKTIGWHKDTDAISISQIASLTGLTDKPITSATTKLTERGLILVEKASGKTTRYTLNYSTIGETPEELPEKLRRTIGETPEELPEKLRTQKKDKETIQKKKDIAPDIEEIRAYVKEKKLNIDPDHFFEFFSVGNWHDSKGAKVLNWKQKALTWHRHAPAGKEEEKLTYEEYRRKYNI